MMSFINTRYNFNIRDDSRQHGARKDREPNSNIKNRIPWNSHSIAPECIRPLSSHLVQKCQKDSKQIQERDCAWTWNKAFSTCEASSNASRTSAATWTEAKCLRHQRLKNKHQTTGPWFRKLALSTRHRFTCTNSNNHSHSHKKSSRKRR